MLVDDKSMGCVHMTSLSLSLSVTHTHTHTWAHSFRIDPAVSDSCIRYWLNQEMILIFLMLYIFFIVNQSKLPQIIDMLPY
jgi:hypothetical protein